MLSFLLKKMWVLNFFQQKYLWIRYCTGLPLTLRLRKSQTSTQEVPDFLPLRFGSPMEKFRKSHFFACWDSLPFDKQNVGSYFSVKQNHHDLYFFQMCFKNIHKNAIISFCKACTYVGPQRKHQQWHNIAFVSKPRERRKKIKYMRENAHNVFLKISSAEITSQTCI